MVRQELIDYIKAGIEKGYTTASLKAILVGNGWNSGEVEEAVGIVEGNQQQAEPISISLPAVHDVKKKKPILLKIICIIGFILCLFGIAMGFMFLFPSSFNYLFKMTPSLANYIAVPFSVDDFFSLVNISYIFAIVVNLIGFVGFILLLKMEKAGMFLVIVAGLANIINSFISFDTLKIINIVVWALIVIYAVLKRKIFI